MEHPTGEQLQLLRLLWQLPPAAVPHPRRGRRGGAPSIAASFDEWRRLMEERRSEKEERRPEREERKAKEERRAHQS